MSKVLFSIASGMTILLLTGAAVASGSLPPSRTESAPLPNVSQPREDTYALGRNVYLTKLACNNCPVAGGVEDKPAAMDLVGRIDSDEFGLSRSEKRQVKTYLKDRFKFR